MADAEIVIVAEHLGDLLGRAYERRGIAVGAGQLRDRGPQPLVHSRPLIRKREQPLCAGGGMAVRWLAITGLVLQRGCALEDRLRPGPGLLLGVGEDRPHREAEARRRPAMFRGGGAHLGSLLAHLRVGFAPQRKRVSLLARDIDRRVRSAAEVDSDALRTIRLYLREGVLDLVIFARIVERLFTRPFGTHDIEEFAGAGVAFVLVVERIAVLPELPGIAAGDDVQC